MNEGLKLLQEIDELLELGMAGYAQITEVYDAESKVKLFLELHLKQGSLVWRKFDKWKSGTHWRDAYPKKYAVRSQLGYLETLREFLAEFIEDADVEVPKHQTWVSANSTYTGRRLLRDCFATATKTIDIQDNFVGTELLNILENCLSDKPSVQVRILTKDGNYKDLKPFLNDWAAFQRQFPLVELKAHDQAHGRFFVIDGKGVFLPGASLKDIGKKADLFTEIIEDKEKQKVITDFETWWLSATIGVQIK